MGEFVLLQSVDRPLNHPLQKMLDEAHDMAYDSWRRLVKDPVKASEELGYDQVHRLSGCPHSRFYRASLSGLKVLLVLNQKALHVFARMQDRVTARGYLAKMTRPHCYQCDKQVAYLFDDGRCGGCTRLTPEEVV